MPGLTPFHIAFPVTDIAEARRFYGSVLGCPEGRSADTWVDFNLYGHQIVAHLVPASGTEALREKGAADRHNPVDGHDVPVPHFGVVLEWPDWEDLAARLTEARVPFIIEPYVRFKGQPGEQGTLFIRDPFGNALEFKTFRNLAQLFAT